MAHGQDPEDLSGEELAEPVERPFQALALLLWLYLSTPLYAPERLFQWFWGRHTAGEFQLLWQAVEKGSGQINPRDFRDGRFWKRLYITCEFVVLILLLFAPLWWFWTPDVPWQLPVIMYVAVLWCRTSPFCDWPPVSSLGRLFRFRSRRKDLQRALVEYAVSILFWVVTLLWMLRPLRELLPPWQWWLW
jgi:hypothetical protein